MHISHVSQQELVRHLSDLQRRYSSNGKRYHFPIKGIGSVNIRMFDGVVRKLQGVRYVPKLKKNLISLGTLDAEGCNYMGQGGALKVSRGALVIMKAIRQGNLYMLTGKTVQSGASHATVEADTDDTKLWHMRLGHMSEKGLNVLHKRGVLKGVTRCKLMQVLHHGEA